MVLGPEKAMHHQVVSTDMEMLSLNTGVRKLAHINGVIPYIR